MLLGAVLLCPPSGTSRPLMTSSQSDVGSFIDGKRTADPIFEEVLFSSIMKAKADWDTVAAEIEGFRVTVFQVTVELMHHNYKTRASLYEAVENLAKLHFATQEKFRSMGL